MPGIHKWALITVLLLVLLESQGALSSPGQTPVGELESRLPVKASFTNERGVMHHGQMLLFLEGQGGSGTRVLHVDSEGSVQETVIPLPAGTRGYGVASVADSVYLFGGMAPVTFGDESHPVRSFSYSASVHRFDPEGGTLEVLDKELPAALADPTTITLGGRVYLFGGQAGPGRTGYLDTIIEFDPETQESIVLGPTLLTPRAGMGGTEVEGRVVLVGGISERANLAEVLVYDPENATVEALESRLPRAIIWPAVQQVDDQVYVLGGRQPAVQGSGWGPTKMIQRIDLEKDDVVLMDAQLPKGLYRAASGVLDGRILLYGGESGCGPTAPTDSVLAYSPRLDAPWNLSAQPQIRPPPADFQLEVDNFTVMVQRGPPCDSSHHVYAYSWNMGDGSPTVETPAVTHTYNASGEYTIRLEVRGVGGVVNSTQRPVQIGDPQTSEAAPVSGIGWALLVMLVSVYAVVLRFSGHGYRLRSRGNS